MYVCVHFLCLHLGIVFVSELTLIRLNVVCLFINISRQYWRECIMSTKLMDSAKWGLIRTSLLHR